MSLTHGPSKTCWTFAGVWCNTNLPELTAANSWNNKVVVSEVRNSVGTTPIALVSQFVITTYVDR